MQLYLESYLDVGKFWVLHRSSSSLLTRCLFDRLSTRGL